MESGKLEEANAIQHRIKTLQNEISSLRDQIEGIRSNEEPINDAFTFLVGKSVTFPHNTQEGEMVSFRFLEEGEAVWIGLGGGEVARAYRKDPQDPRKVFVWWPDRDNLPGYEITVSEDGKKAQVKNLNSQHLDLGTIK